MPPHTTYLRLPTHSSHSSSSSSGIVLQLRIFTEHPLDAGPRWLLHPTDPALPKIIRAIRHLILPKLREENLRKYGGKGSIGPAGGGRKGMGKRRVKDVVVTDAFEVSLFLTELSTRHSLLVKQKVFRNRKPRLTTSSQTPILIPEEEEDNNNPTLETIPQHHNGDEMYDEEPEVIASDSDRASPDIAVSDDDNDDDKKKSLTFKTTYGGYSIWGWTLVLLVKRKDHQSTAGSGGGRSKTGTAATEEGGKQAENSSTTTTTTNDPMMGLRDPSSTSMAEGDGASAGGLMEEWISTQAVGDVNVDDEYEGD